MGYTRRLVTLASKDRTNGEEIPIHGAALRVDVGADSPEVFIAFNDPNYDRIRVRSGEVLRTTFDRVFVFHASLVAGIAPLELVAMEECDAILSGRLSTLATPMYRYVEGYSAEALAPGLFEELHGITAVGGTEIAAPTAGRALTLLRYRLAISANAAMAAAGVQTLKIQEWDGAAAGDVVHEHRFYLPAATLANALGALDTGWTDLGPVGRKLATGNTLRLVLGTALSAGGASAWIQAVDG